MTATIQCGSPMRSMLRSPNTVSATITAYARRSTFLRANYASSLNACAALARNRGSQSSCPAALSEWPHGLVERTMSNKFESLDANEKAALESTLYRCRALVGRIGEELRKKKPEHFVDEKSLEDFHASLEHAASLLEQTIHAPTSTVNGLQEGSRQRHR